MVYFLVYLNKRIEKKRRNDPALLLWQERENMKKNDWILAGSVVLLAAVLWIAFTVFRSGDNTAVLITVDGEEYGTYSLEEDQEISIGDTNVCRISNGKAKMISATCPDHLCMKQRAVDNRGGTIVCLPNRVVIEAVAEKEAEIDGISG